MTDLIHVTYAQTGHSSKINQYGMREMQANAFESRNSQYLLLKAPPASGRSRALMFIALDVFNLKHVKHSLIHLTLKTKSQHNFIMLAFIMLFN